MGKKKRRHHYVFQAYLKPWLIDNKLWCLRNNKTFPAATINVAQERDFYRIKELNADELKFYESLCTTSCAEVKQALLKHVEDHLLLTKAKADITEKKDIISKHYNGKMPNEIKKAFENMFIKLDIGINNAYEDYYCKIEGESIKWLDFLKKKSTDFYYNNINNTCNILDDEPFHFIHFLCIQFYRTKAIKENWIKGASLALNNPKFDSLRIPKENISLENLAPLFFWEWQNALACSLRKIKSAFNPTLE